MVKRAWRPPLCGRNPRRLELGLVKAGRRAVVARAGGQSIGSGVAGDTGKAAVVVLRGRAKQTG